MGTCGMQGNMIVLGKSMRHIHRIHLCMELVHVGYFSSLLMHQKYGVFNPFYINTLDIWSSVYVKS